MKKKKYVALDEVFSNIGSFTGIPGARTDELVELTLVEMVKGTPLNKIAQRVGVSSDTLSRHFTSRYNYMSVQQLYKQVRPFLELSATIYDEDGEGRQRIG